MITQVDLVNYLINSDDELRETYDIYQNLLDAIKNNNYKLLENILINSNNNISDYMKTSIKTLKGYLIHIKNTLTYLYNNGYIVKVTTTLLKH